MQTWSHGATIYGNRMQKTTVYLDEDVYRRLKQVAQQRHRAPAEMIREAVAVYTDRHAQRRKPRSVGRFTSGRPDLGQHAEELLGGLGNDE